MNARYPDCNKRFFFKNTKAFVLPWTLGLIFLISLLFLSATQALLLFERALSATEEAHAQLYRMEKIMPVCIARDEVQKHCSFKQNKVNEIIDFLKKDEHCLFLKEHFLYSCALEEFSIDEQKPFKRHTLLALEQGKMWVLQYVRQDSRAGIQAWRYFKID